MIFEWLGSPCVNGPINANITTEDPCPFQQPFWISSTACKRFIEFECDKLFGHTASVTCVFTLLSPKVKAEIIQ